MFECASALARDPGVRVLIACRDVGQGERAAQRLREAGGDVTLLALDLARQTSIRAFVEAFRAGRFPPLAAVVCNAGVQNVGAGGQTPLHELQAMQRLLHL